MREYIEKLCVILLFVFNCINTKSYTEVTVEKGGYNVLVSFAQNVPSKDGVELMNDMKESLTEASKILHSAIGLGFSKVIFKIPFPWKTLEWNLTIEETANLSSSKATFLISNTNDNVFGKMPFAQQYGMCGIPGSQIAVPTAFFDKDNKFPKGIYLAREWLKYRYGVFDENGYFGDSQYPLYYVIPGTGPNKVKITGCTNKEVEYSFRDEEGSKCPFDDKALIDRLDSKECSIKPEKDENITSSIMYFQEDLHTLEHICGKDSDHNHNSRAPNKQNTICKGRSIWDVVKKSSDFQQEKNEKYRDVEYVYEQEAAPKIVVVWENTEQLKEKGPVILSALKNFVIDLPDRSKFNGFPFKSSVPEGIRYELFDINEMDDKRRVVEFIASDFVRDEEGDINLAISTALKVFSDADVKQGTIIIIGRSIQTAEEEVLEKLKETKICLMFILLSEDEGGIPTDEMDEIERYRSASSCSVVEEFLTTAKDEDIYVQLLEIIDVLLPPSADKAKETAKIAYLSENNSISLSVSDSIETVTFTIFSRKEGENFELSFNKEKLENVLKQELIADVITLTFSPKEAGDIEFQYPHEAPRMLTHVTTTSKKGKFFSGEIYVHESSEEGSAQMPVIIYAVIRYGNYPVQNAKVKATVERPNADAITFDLKDDGKGNPDITKNDGVYSRYFIMFSENGIYTVTVNAMNDEDLTTFGADENAGYQSCCGSYVNSDTSQLTEFTHEIKTTFEAKSGRPDEGYKPLRISDLKIDKITEDKIFLKWTAPGEEADNGTASLYEIKCFTSQDEAANNFDNGSAVFNSTATPKSSGEEENFEIDLKGFKVDRLYYVAIKTKNLKQTSDVSNIAEIFNAKEMPTEAPGTKKGTADSKTIGIIIGITLLIIILIIIYLLVHFLIVKPKQREKEKEQNAPQI